MNTVWCFFGHHDWKSTRVGETVAQTIRVNPNVTIEMQPRTFWDNECRRCGKFVGPTWRYGADASHREEAS